MRCHSHRSIATDTVQRALTTLLASYPLLYLRLGRSRAFFRVCARARARGGEANAATGIVPPDFTERASAVEMLSAGSN